MKLTRDRLKQIIKEELEEIMSVSETDIKVSVSPESLPQPLNPSQEREITSSTSSKAFEMQGKRYIIVWLPNGKVKIFNSNTDILQHARGKGLEPQPVYSFESDKKIPKDIKQALNAKIK